MNMSRNADTVGFLVGIARVVYVLRVTVHFSCGEGTCVRKLAVAGHFLSLIANAPCPRRL